MAIGDIGLWNGAANVIPGTTFAAYNLLNTQTRNDGIYTDAGTGLLEFDEAGIYLVRWAITYTDSSNGRCNYQTRAVQTTGTGHFFTTYHTGYNRNSANTFATAYGYCFIVAAINDQITIQHRRDTDAPTGGTLTQSNLDVVKIADTGGIDYAIYESTSAGNAYSGTTPNDVAFATTVVETDTATIEKQAGNTDIRLKRDNARYLMIYGVAGDTGGSRTQRVSRMVSGTTEISDSYSYVYQRNSSNEYGGLAKLVAHEVGTTDEDVSVQVWQGDGIAAGQGGCDVAGSWTNNSGEETALLVIDMPDHWESAKYHDSTAAQDTNTAGLALNIFRDTDWEDAAFSRDSNTQMTIATAIDVLALGSIGTGRQNVASGTRFGWGMSWEIEGVTDLRGEHRQYTRGNQGSQDCFGGAWEAGSIFANTANDTYEMQMRDRGDNGSQDRTLVNRCGAFFLNLDSLEATSTTITASGTPSLSVPTANGGADIVKTASGAVTAPVPTISGIASIAGAITASGAPSLPLPTAAGDTDIMKTASGAPVLPVLTAAGAAAINKTASGAPIVPMPAASGDATLVKTASGAPSLPVPTTLGVVGVIKTASGAPIVPLIEAAGSSFIWPRVYLNTTQTLTGATELTVTSASADGTSITFDDPLGPPTGALFLGVENQNNGEVGWIAVTVTTSGADVTSSGTPSLPVPTAAGVAQVIKTASGAPVLPVLTAVGSAENIKTASGAATLPLIEAAGLASVAGQIIASGAATLSVPTISGAASIVKTALGTPNVPVPTAAGQASIVKTASGALAVSIPLAAGSAQTRVTASGTPTLPLPIAAGVAERILSATGLLTTPIPTSVGTAETPIVSNGNLIVPVPVISGSAIGPGNLVSFAFNLEEFWQASFWGDDFWAPGFWAERRPFGGGRGSVIVPFDTASPEDDKPREVLISLEDLALYAITAIETSDD
jgi:hypothetical protein